MHMILLAMFVVDEEVVNSINNLFQQDFVVEIIEGKQ